MVDKEETNIGAHALLVIPQGKLILQQRDDRPGIVNPGLISMFGGTIKKSDNLATGLQRELSEELELKISPQNCHKLGIYKKTKELDGVDYTLHVYVIKDIDPTKLILHEGKGFIIDSSNILLGNPKLTRITRKALKDYIKMHE